MMLILVSCGSFLIPFSKSKVDALDIGNYRPVSASDYADHLSSLKNAFISTPGTKIVSMSPSLLKYFEKLSNEIISKNEIFFRDLKVASISVLETDSPLHFSLPKGEIFLSRGLISKYIKHESMLVSILAYELVRSEKLLYHKTTLVPEGYVSLEKIINLNRLPLESKMEVHKWAYHVTNRSGYDGEYYLSYLQTQNRNTADFLLNTGDINQINREESLFKAFLIKNPQKESAIKQNSSKDFYALLNRLRDGVI